jgi:tetratricopeptide (TPR) repeat protein
VKIVLRLAAACGLALLATAAPVGADDIFQPKAPSATGSFLAGQQALSELRTSDAAQFFHDASLEQWDNPEVVSRTFVAYAANGQMDDAVGAARHALELDKTNQLARLIVATDAVRQRRYGAAVDMLENLDPDTFEGLTGSILKAWALTGDGKVDDAFGLLDKLGKGGMEEFFVFHRAMMADVAGRQAEAIKYITAAHDADPFTADIVEAYARILGNSGDFAKGLDAITAFEAQGLDSPQVTVVKNALLKQQRPGLFADSIQAGGAEMFHSIGVAFARQGSSDVAMVLMRLGQYLNPRNDNVLLVIGQLYDGAHQYKLANSVYDSLPQSSPMRPLATVRIADNLDALGDRPQAISRLTDIVASNPTDVDAISVLGDLYRSDKKFSAATDAYSKALGVTGGTSPGDWRFYYVRGIAYQQNNQFPLAEKDFLKALDLNPGQPQVLNYLGYTWVDKGMNLSRALDMIQKAVDATHNGDGYIVDSLGWAFYRLGRYQDAVTQLEQAATLLPNDPEINDHLGDAYWQVGRKLEAHFQWNVAYSLDTTGDVKARVAPKLKGGLDAAPKDGDSAPVLDTPAPADQPSAAPAN